LSEKYLKSAKFETFKIIVAIKSPCCAMWSLDNKAEIFTKWTFPTISRIDINQNSVKINDFIILHIILDIIIFNYQDIEYRPLDMRIFK